MRGRLPGGHDIHPDAPLVSRWQVVETCRRELEQESCPRLHMALLMLLTAGIGWLASAMLLAAGMQAMWMRYPAAFAIAYAGFLALLWLWLHRKDLDAPDLGSGDWTGSQPCGRGSGTFQGGGGRSGGGGASGSFESPPVDCSGAASGGAADWGAADVVGAADEIVVPIVAVVAAVLLALGVVLASIYVVYTAPSLFAEITVDAALSYVLVRRVRRNERRWWLGTAIARTWLPALGTAAFLAALGVGVALAAPGTTSLAGAFHRLLGG